MEGQMTTGRDKFFRCKLFTPASNLTRPSWLAYPDAVRHIQTRLPRWVAALLAVALVPSFVVPAGIHVSLCLTHSDDACHGRVAMHAADDCGSSDQRGHVTHVEPEEQGCCGHDGAPTPCLNFEWVTSDDPVTPSNNSVQVPDAPVDALTVSFDSMWRPSAVESLLAPTRRAQPPPRPSSPVVLQTFRC